MTLSLPPEVTRILERPPHRVAFGALVRALDALPPLEAAALAEVVAEKIAGWPAETRAVTVGPRQAEPAAAALRLARRLSLFLVGRERLPALTEMVARMPELDGVDVDTIDPDFVAPFLRALPKRVRHVGIGASPPRVEAPEHAKEVCAALDGLEALESVDVAAGHATTAIVEHLFERPLAGFTARLAALTDLNVLRRLDAKALRSLSLNGIDGIPATFGEVFGELVTALNGLVELDLPWFEGAWSSSLPKLERLTVLGFDGAMDTPSTLRSLPTTLRSLRTMSCGADATVAAFERCPQLVEVSWGAAPFSAAGLEAFVASGALERLEVAPLGNVLDRKLAARLFAETAPAALRVLELSADSLGGSAGRALASSKGWLDRLVELKLENCKLPDATLSEILGAAGRSRVLVFVDAAGNRAAAASRCRAQELAARGVVVGGVRFEEAPSPTAPVAVPAAQVTNAWSRIDAWLAREPAVRSGLGAPASAVDLASAARLPASLRAMYAAHDGVDGLAELLGLGDVVWWRLGEIAREPELVIDDRTFAVFGAYIEEDGMDPGEYPTPDDDVDALLAIDVETEEVVVVNEQHGSVSSVAESLGALLERVATALTSGTLVLDENGRPTASTPAAVAAPPRSTAVADLATLLVKNDLVELAADCGVADLVRAIEKALEAKTPKARKKAVLRVFDEDPCVAEVFADDEQLEEIAASLV